MKGSASVQACIEAFHEQYYIDFEDGSCNFPGVEEEFDEIHEGLGAAMVKGADAWKAFH